MSPISLSRARLPATLEIEVLDEYGDPRRQAIAAERPLTLYLNKREIVTLMTLGADPEALVVGYLRNQGLLGRREDLEAVHVDWEVEAAAVVTRHLPEDLDERLGHRTVTTGCGQGTVFGRILDAVPEHSLPDAPVRTWVPTTRPTAAPARCTAVRCAGRTRYSTSWRTLAATTPWIPWRDASGWARAIPPGRISSTPPAG